MIKRHFTAHSINAVINDPSVYDWVRGAAEGHLDVSPAVENEDNVLLMGEYGGVLFLKHQPGVYEAHTQVLPAGRGKWSVDMVQEALRWMFTRTDAVDIITRIPQGNLGARALAKAINGRLEFHLKEGWIKNGKVIPADIFSLRIQDWMARAPGLEDIGEWFHKRLEEEYAKHDYKEPIHEDDPLHDRYVGAAVATIMGGQPHKAVVFYNRWAGISGYAPIQLVSTDPIVINIRDALLDVKDDDFAVLRIR